MPCNQIKMVQTFSNVLNLAKDDDEFMMTFIVKSTEDLEVYLQNLKDASSNGNLALLLFTQHKSKTLLSLLGNSSVPAAIESMVEKAKAQDWEHTAELIQLEIDIRGLILKINSELKPKEALK